MKEAADLLLNTDLPVSEIIASIGYQNRTTFYRQFERRYHMSPAMCRKKGQLALEYLMENYQTAILDEYEENECYSLEYVDTEVAIGKNRHVGQSPYNPLMLEREARVVKMLIEDGLFGR